ncbi:hypothetical protein BHQ15_17865 [Mycolicibacillus koreensis]|nr:hypothetical protein BHQ15_17865 [Mycolicibacillus koreensis]
MNTKSKELEALLKEEAAASEKNRDAPIPEGATVTRGNGRSKVLQIRLNPDELEELERVAASRGLPPSTLAREAILRFIRPGEAQTESRRRLVDEFTRYLDATAHTDAACTTEDVVTGIMLSGQPQRGTSQVMTRIHQALSRVRSFHEHDGYILFIGPAGDVAAAVDTDSEAKRDRV